MNFELARASRLAREEEDLGRSPMLPLPDNSGKQSAPVLTIPTSYDKVYQASHHDYEIQR